LEPTSFTHLSEKIREWALELGFQGTGITNTQLGEHESRLEDWLAENFHGEMSYMAAHGKKRSRPAELVEDTVRIISLRMDYLPQDTNIASNLASDSKAYIARYAMGRDYHKVIRKKLVKLWSKIETYCLTHNLGQYKSRVFTDSAPVLEKAIAEKAGLGWIGKNTLLLNRNAGSWFFLGEIFTDIPLEPDKAYSENHCGSCTSCIDICPTKAIVAPYKLDARKCISYLTIEHRGVIDLSLRKAMGNRIFGCDDCQVFCPWNKFANHTNEPDFTPRNNLDKSELLELFSWSEEEFLKKTEGSAIRRTGFEGWQRNIAIALGNANYSAEIIHALEQKRASASPLVTLHINWALDEQESASHSGI
jgi:epoxyqueuosine reductase